MTHTKLLFGLFASVALVSGCYQGVEVPDVSDKESLYAQSQLERLRGVESDTVSVQVNLRRWMTFGELEGLVGQQGVDVVQVIAKIPDEGTPPSPDSGWHMSVPVADDMSDSTLAMVEKMIEEIEPMSPEKAEDLQTRLEQGVESLVFVYSLRVTGEPEQLAEWGEGHPNEIRFLQPIISEIDGAQHSFFPTENLP